MKLDSLNALPDLTNFPKPGEPEKVEIKLDKPQLTAAEKARDRATRFEEYIGSEFDKFPLRSPTEIICDNTFGKSARFSFKKTDIFSPRLHSGHFWS